MPVHRQHSPVSSIASAAVRDTSYSRPSTTSRRYTSFRELPTGQLDSFEFLYETEKPIAHPGVASKPMRSAIDMSAIGAWGSPRQMSELAALAERSGWDGLFVEDYVMHAEGSTATTHGWRGGDRDRDRADPDRRSRRAAATPAALEGRGRGALDRPSVRRTQTLGVGSGDITTPDIIRVGEVADARSRGEMLDEALELIDGLWTGEPFTRRAPLPARRRGAASPAGAAPPDPDLGRWQLHATAPT